MKVKYTIGKAEKERIIESINIDPCHEARCNGVHCVGCPISTASDKFRSASEEIIRILTEMEEYEDE